MAERAGGMKATRMPAGGFEERALPVAMHKRMGVSARKVFGQEQLVDAAPVEKLPADEPSLPMSLASCDMRVEFVERSAAPAREFRPMPEAGRRRLIGSIAAGRRVSLLDLSRHHADICPAGLAGPRRGEFAGRRPARRQS